MSWKPVPKPSKDESAALRELEGKARFLVDENLGQSIVEDIRQLGLNVRGVAEVGLSGHPDENVFAFARRENRILLTKDRGFLNERRYPLRQTSGVVILPDAPIDGDVFLDALATAILIVRRFRKAYSQTKLVVNEDDTVVIICRNLDTGAIEKDRYLRSKHGEVLYWDENADGV